MVARLRNMWWHGALALVVAAGLVAGVPPVQVAEAAQPSGESSVPVWPVTTEMPERPAMPEW